MAPAVVRTSGHARELHFIARIGAGRFCELDVEDDFLGDHRIELGAEAIGRR
jgi:hypothetical protein